VQVGVAADVLGLDPHYAARFAKPQTLNSKP